jgi:pimeloyl-ACP methyl ester carboxylesterase
MKKQMLHAWSGFLGSKWDWDFLRSALGGAYDLRVHCPDPREGENWRSWAERWTVENPYVERELHLGYSLGARAAAHIVTLFPERCLGFLAASFNPGLTSLSEKESRVQSDLKWARRFSPDSGEAWEDLMNAWDAQDVFGGFDVPLQLEVNRLDSIELRSRSVRQLTVLGLGAQEDLTPVLLETRDVPQIWANGALDQKFCAFGRKVEGLTPRLTHYEVPNQGHRWLWEMKVEKSTQLILSFLNQLQKGNL